MSSSLKVYKDAALNDEITKVSFLRPLDGSAAAVDRVVYFGNPTAGITIMPVVDSNVTISVVDSASSSGVPASAIKLATTQAGLATATAGAALTLGASLSSGVSNAQPVWMRILTGVLAGGTYNDVSLATNVLADA